MPQLTAFLRAHGTLAPPDVDKVRAAFEPVALAATEWLLRPGRECTHYYFVEAGSCRVMYEAGEREVNGWLAFEGDFFTELASFRSGRPSHFGIQALEPLRVLRLSRAAHTGLLRTVPGWSDVVREVWETAFLRIVDGILAFQTQTAAERYAALLQQHPRAHELPLKHLAAFLGITASSLSRLRAQKK